MIPESEILERINEIIVDEQGTAVTIDSTFLDAQLDSLGTMITLITIDSEFQILDQSQAEVDFKELDIPNLTIRDLITKCVSSTTNTSTVQKTE